ncbi:MAG: hypothetical protein VX641_00825 [Planctomycetota bacterium]|nr:hypothetical protein [Planctomycetota bacterium]
MKNSSPTPVPLRSRLLVQGGMLLMLSLYCFITYALIRPLFGTFGFDVFTVGKSLLVVLVLGVFVLWLAPMVHVPSILHQHVYPRRRFLRGQCPGCGYPRSDRNPGSCCSECGTEFREPPEWRMRSSVVVSFLVLFVSAMIIGSAVAETRLLADERQWLQDCTAPGGDQLESRSRIWPSGHAYLFNDPVAGPYAEPVAGSTRDPNARRRLR